MSSKQFLILIGTGIFCAVLFAAPGLYQLSKEYEKDKSLEWQRISKNGTWYEITRSDKYQSLNDDQPVNKKGQNCPAHQAMKNPNLMSYLESLIRSRLQHVRHVSLSAVPVRERMSEVTRM